MATHRPSVGLTAAQAGPVPKPVSHHQPLLPPSSLVQPLVLGLADPFALAAGFCALV